MAARTKAAKTTARKAGKAAAGARTNPYVQRFIEDPELRDNVRAAVDHARHAYKRMSNGKGPAKVADGGPQAPQGAARDGRFAVRKPATSCAASSKRRTAGASC